MPEHSIHLKWFRDTPDFDYSSYTRTHTVSFGTYGKIFGSASQEFHGDPQYLDPEQAFVMSLSSCHLLTFLALASKQGFIVDSYTDQALGEMGKNKAGKLAILKVILRPIIVFGGDKKPSEEEFHVLHDQAKDSCVIANSIASCVEFTTEARMKYQ